MFILCYCNDMQFPHIRGRCKAHRQHILWCIENSLRYFGCDYKLLVQCTLIMVLNSALLAICEGNPPVTGGFPSQRLVTQSFDVFFDLRNKWLSKQSKHRWFETPLCSLWRHCNDFSVKKCQKCQHIFAEYCWSFFLRKQFQHMKC